MNQKEIISAIEVASARPGCACGYPFFFLDNVLVAFGRVWSPNGLRHARLPTMLSALILDAL
jgi:hypothetical protein